MGIGEPYTRLPKAERDTSLFVHVGIRGITLLYEVIIDTHHGFITVGGTISTTLSKGLKEV
jgi:hypothetical protein